MDWIESILTGIIIAIFFAYSNYKSKEKVKKGTNGKYHLKLNASYKWVGIVTIIIGLALLIYAFISDEEGIFVIASVSIIIVTGLGVSVLKYYQNHSLIFDKESITVKNWKGDLKTIHWKDVSNIKFSPRWGYLRVYSNSQKLNIHQHLVGLGEFLRMMEEKTEYKARDLKLPF